MKKNVFFIFFIINIFTINSKEEKDIFEANKNLRFCGADLDKIGIQQYISKAKQIKKRETRSLSTLTYRPIRIFLETVFFESKGSEDPNLIGKMPLLMSALKKAVNGMQDLIEVEDIGDTNLYSDIDMKSLFNNNLIYQWSPIFDSTNDIQSDFLLLVKFDNNNQNPLPSGVLASAIPIAPEPETNRPIIGLLTVSTETSFYSRGRISEYFSEVFLHEITHALGFLYTMFQYYPNKMEGTISTETIRGVVRNVIITPTVMEVAKKYYNCAYVRGVELEDQGGAGSESSHWDQRILLGEYMGAIIYQEEMVVSEFTLALLEDTGWYKANYYTGGLMRFGKNKGCDFLYNACMETEHYTTQFGNEFFDYDNKWAPSCSTGRLSRTYSIPYTYDYIYDEKYSDNFIPIPNSNQYNSGSMYTTDYCLTHGQYPTESFAYFTGGCKLGNGNYGSIINYYNYEKGIYEYNYPNSMLPNELGEIYSNNSFCIMSSLVPTGKYKMFGSILHPMCYQMYCSSSYLTIQINNDYVVCPRTGGNVEVKGYDGKIHCPDYNLICTGTVLCNDMFDCIEKKSLIKNDTYYYNYTSLTTQQFSELPKVATLVDYEYSDDGICPLFCSQCTTNKKCKICLNGYNYIGVEENDDQPIICDNRINIEKGYYKANDNVYYLCDKSCETCSEKMKCISCSDNYYILENSHTECYNLTNYPKGYYFNNEKNVFSACHTNCETCSEGPISNNTMNCDTCKEGLIYNETNKSCLKEEKSDKKKSIKKKSNNVFLAVFIPIIIIIIIAGIGFVVFIMYKKKKAPNGDRPSNIEMTSEV